MAKGIIKRKDGARYSGEPSYLKKTVKHVKRSWGGAAFNSFQHKVWKDSFAGLQGMPPGDAGIAVGDLFSTYLYGSNSYLTIFVDGEGVMSFAKSATLRDSDGGAILDGIQYAMDGGYEQKAGFLFRFCGSQKSIFASVYPVGGKIHLSAICGDATGYVSFDFRESELRWNPPAGSPISIVCNIFMYMMAFEECVVEGPPNLTKPYQGRSLCLKSESQFSELQRVADVSPHMRRGHFRLLKSERYTNARGKVVYVKPTMVKGKAVTVHG